MLSASWFLAMTSLLTAAPPVIREAGREDGPIWVRHTIDGTSRGADGVKCGDFDGDGRLDLVTGWEEGGEVRVYRNPGPPKVREAWPKVTAGRVASPEDAIFADFDGDGRLDVVSCCEGKTKTAFLHRLKPDSQDWLNAEGWTTEPLPATRGNTQWMQAVIVPGTGKLTSKLALGAKNEGASVGLLALPVSGSVAASATFRNLRPAGWIMSLVAADMDGDGDFDLVLTDRKGNRTGAFWLENPGDEASLWPEQTIGAAGREAMFADPGDVDGDGMADLAIAVKPRDVVLCRRTAEGGWNETIVRLAPEGIGDAKAVAIADLDGDGRMDLVFSCENAHGAAEGICWLRQDGSGGWKRRPLGGPEGTKFDLIRTLDLDADGDLDVITCEEKDGLGVIWYENPLVAAKR